MKNSRTSNPQKPLRKPSPKPQASKSRSSKFQSAKRSASKQSASSNNAQGSGQSRMGRSTNNPFSRQNTEWAKQSSDRGFTFTPWRNASESQRQNSLRVTSNESFSQLSEGYYQRTSQGKSGGALKSISQEAFNDGKNSENEYQLKKHSNGVLDFSRRGTDDAQAPSGAEVANQGVKTPSAVESTSKGATSGEAEENPTVEKGRQVTAQQNNRDGNQGGAQGSPPMVAGGGQSSDTASGLGAAETPVSSAAAKKGAEESDKETDEESRESDADSDDVSNQGDDANEEDAPSDAATGLGQGGTPAASEAVGEEETHSIEEVVEVTDSAEEINEGEGAAPTVSSEDNKNVTDDEDKSIEGSEGGTDSDDVSKQGDDANEEKSSDAASGLGQGGTPAASEAVGEEETHSIEEVVEVTDSAEEINEREGAAPTVSSQETKNVSDDKDSPIKGMESREADADSDDVSNQVSDANEKEEESSDAASDSDQGGTPAASGVEEKEEITSVDPSSPTLDSSFFGGKGQIDQAIRNYTEFTGEYLNYKELYFKGKVGNRRPTQKYNELTADEKLSIVEHLSTIDTDIEIGQTDRVERLLSDQIQAKSGQGRSEREVNEDVKILNEGVNKAKPKLEEFKKTLKELNVDVDSASAKADVAETVQLHRKELHDLREEKRAKRDDAPVAQQPGRSNSDEKSVQKVTSRPQQERPEVSSPSEQVPGFVEGNNGEAVDPSSPALGSSFSGVKRYIHQAIRDFTEFSGEYTALRNLVKDKAQSTAIEKLSDSEKKEIDEHIQKLDKILTRKELDRATLLYGDLFNATGDQKRPGTKVSDDINQLYNNFNPARADLKNFKQTLRGLDFDVDSASAEDDVKKAVQEHWELLRDLHGEKRDKRDDAPVTQQPGKSTPSEESVSESVVNISAGSQPPTSQQNPELNSKFDQFFQSVTAGYAFGIATHTELLKNVAKPRIERGDLSDEEIKGIKDRDAFFGDFLRSPAGVALLSLVENQQAAQQPGQTAKTPTNEDFDDQKKALIKNGVDELNKNAREYQEYLATLGGHVKNESQFEDNVASQAKINLEALVPQDNGQANVSTPNHAPERVESRGQQSTPPSSDIHFINDVSGSGQSGQETASLYPPGSLKGFYDRTFSNFGELTKFNEGVIKTLERGLLASSQLNEQQKQELKTKLDLYRDFPHSKQSMALAEFLQIAQSEEGLIKNANTPAQDVLPEHTIKLVEEGISKLYKQTQELQRFLKDLHEQIQGDKDFNQKLKDEVMKAHNRLLKIDQKKVFFG